MTTKITVRNLETGEVGLIRRKWYDNPRINGGVLVEVAPGSKPYAPDLWKSKIGDDSAGDEPDEKVEED